MDQLRAIFPAWATAIKSQEQYNQIRREWLTGLVEAGIRDERVLQVGLRKARASETPFLPSVGQFVGWCRDGLGEMVGLPDEGTAYRLWNEQASRTQDARTWEQYHPAIYWAHTKLAAERHSLMAERNDDKRRKRFGWAWRQAQEAAAAGTDFAAMLPRPEDVKAKKTPTPEQRREAEAARAKLMEMIRTN